MDIFSSGMADEEVNFICTVLADAVAVLEDAESSLLNRNEAQRFCDELKSNPQLCVPCALKLTKRSKTIPVRLFGYQILEYYVTHHWTVASPKEKKDLQTKVIASMSYIANSIKEEGEAIRESMARVVVEMIKREESKNWLSMMEELKAVMVKGPVQGELVMLVLLRLSEDAFSIKGEFPVPLYRVTFDNNIDFILKMLRSLIQCRFEQYERVKIRPREPTVRACARVLLAAVKTMAAYLVPLENYYVEVLCCLLSCRDVQVEASECLLSAINILAIQPNDTPMLVLFDTVASQYIFQVSRTHEVLASKDYCFLKNVCNIMCVFGDQFCRMILLKAWHRKVPLSFGSYLDSLLGFTTHSSHYLSSLTQSTWKALFSLEMLSKDPRLLAVIPKYLSALRTNLLNVGFPSKNNSPSCEFSRNDFVTDVEFCKFLRNFRDDQKQVIEVLCRRDHITCFKMASEWLKDMLLPPKKSSPIAGNLQSNSTSSLLECEPMTFCFKVIVTTMFEKLKREVIPVNDCVQLLQLLLNFKTKDPGILASVPINIHTLLPLLHFKNEYLIPVLTKLLEIIEEVNVKSHNCNLVRRDACMCIIQLCESHAKFLLPSFTLLFNYVKQLLCDEMLHLTQMVKSTLMQAMVILINNFEDFEQKKTYLEELMVPVSSLWLSEDMQIILAVPGSFVLYVGGDLNITDTAMESPTDLNRSGIIHCVATILGVLQWTWSPTKQNCLNPCANQVLKLLDNLFVLIRTQHNLYFPGVLSKMGKLFSKSVNQSEIKNNSSLERPQALLDVYDPQEYSTALERMQEFFNVLYSCCFSILGCACSSLNNYFYSINNLADKIGNSAFVNLEYIPNYRLLCIIRLFLSPFLLNCPPEYYESLVSPVMGFFLTSVRLRLFYGWNDIDETSMTSKAKSEFEKSKLEEKILTKEVLQLIIDCCVDKDKIAITDGPNVINAQHEWHEEVSNPGTDVISFASTVCSQDPGLSISSAGSEDAESLVSAVSRQGIDDNLVIAESDVCCVPNEDAVTFVCTTESDDDDNMSIAGAHFSILSEKVDKAKRSDFTCYLRNENTDSSIVVSNSCSAANQGLECIVVAEKSDNVCALLDDIDTSFVSSDNIDGEMAAEVPLKQNSIAKEQAPLTTLGICLMKDEDVRSILLNTSFSALMWKDFCHKAATCLCWPLLQHVMSEPCIVDTVIHLFTKVMKAFEVHRHDLLVSDTFDYLAYHIYASFRPRYIELNRVMRQIPNINLVSLDTFDEMLLDATIHKPDTGLQQFFKDLIKSDVHEPFREKEHIVDNVPKSSSKSMKHQMSTELPETARKLIKR